MPNPLKTTDPEVYEAIRKEGLRQREKILLIASENFASPAVLAAQGSLMTNKYAEGYPGRRYYGGCQYMDVVESLAIERAKQIFGADHVNVQPHSGAQANMAVYFTVLKPGDAILGMDLAHGGHLTHGSRVSFSGILYRAYSYGVDRTTERIDYDAVGKMAGECRLPRSPRGAVDARHRRQGRRPERGALPRLQEVPAAGCGERQGPGDRPPEARPPDRVGGHGYPSDAGGRHDERDDRQGSRSGAGRGGHHGQQERDPVR